MNTEIAWCAGLLEGEAYFGIGANGSTPKISCEMTDLDVLEKLQSILGGVIRIQKLRNDKWKQTWCWYVHGKEAVRSMILIYDFLLHRRKSKIDSILSVYFDRQEQLYARNELLQFVRSEWRAGNGSLRQLAKTYKFSHETIRKTV